MKYFKRNWEDIREDEFGNWGNSIWYFETDLKGAPIRQIEKYENGKVLKYHQNHLEDDFGMLGDQELDLEEFKAFEITKDEFEKNWNEQ